MLTQLLWRSDDGLIAAPAAAAVVTCRWPSSRASTLLNCWFLCTLPTQLSSERCCCCCCCCCLHSQVAKQQGEYIAELLVAGRYSHSSHADTVPSSITHGTQCCCCCCLQVARQQGEYVAELLVSGRYSQLPC
jgi:hypothetical protein